MGGSTNHFVPTQEAIEWINGEMLGDGCLCSRSRVSAHFVYTSSHLEYIQYVFDTLRRFGIAQSGKIRERSIKDGKYHAYTGATRAYVGLKLLHMWWYPEGKKAVPRGLVLTPLVCRQWYIGDGSLLRKRTRSPCIKLSTCSFSKEDVEWLVKQLWDIGILASRQACSNEIYIPVRSTKGFLGYIGECPVECYKYKWDYGGVYH